MDWMRLSRVFAIDDLVVGITGAIHIQKTIWRKKNPTTDGDGEIGVWQFRLRQLTMPTHKELVTTKH